MGGKNLMFLLEGKNLTKRYKNRARETDALRDISFYLKEKEFLGIVGESGSGKSTLLRLIAGLERPDSGILTYRGDEYQWVCRAISADDLSGCVRLVRPEASYGRPDGGGPEEK